DLRLEHPQRGSFFFEFMDQVENIACRTAEPIKTQDDKLVTGAQELHDRLKFRAPASRSAGAGFRTNDPTPGVLEARDLNVEILVCGADAGVTDTTHGKSVTLGWFAQRNVT